MNATATPPAPLRAERRQGKRRYFKKLRSRRIFQVAPINEGYFAIAGRGARQATRSVHHDVLAEDYYEVARCKKCRRMKPLEHAHA